MHSRVSRRGFLKAAGVAGASALAGPYILKAQQPNKKLGFAFIGTGGRGGSHLGMAKDDVCIAYCDTDESRWPTKNFPGAKGYTDYRKMLETHAKDIDNVVVAIPDHSHAAAAMMAIKMGKNVYCEKPLTWCVSEARALAEATAKAKVATQMGNQGHANTGTRLVVSWIQSGLIGEIKEVHTWTNRPVWPQGIAQRPPTQPVPAGLNWDCWIGPAPFRDFHKGLHSFDWRGWFDFGCGAIGDMGCHTWDAVYWAMGVDYPSAVELLKIENKTKETFASRTKFKWTFPAKGNRPAFNAYWYSGGWKPETPEEIINDPARKATTRPAGLPGTGSLYVGTKGKLLVGGDYSNSPRLIPESFMKQAQAANLTEQKIPSSPGHPEEWIMASRGEKPWDFPGSNFAKYSGPLTEVMLLGAIVEKVGEVGFKLECDPVNRTILTREALALASREYRNGWTL